jgi:aldose sugar dehydrogenase
VSRQTVFFLLSLSVATSAALVACGGGNDVAPVATPTLAPALPFEINLSAPPPPTSSGVMPKLTVFTSGLTSPWSLVFVPDGTVADAYMLVTQKGGTLVRVNSAGVVSAPISGVPIVDSRDNGGLLDIVLDPQFTTNRRLYLSFTEPVVSGSTTRTAVARGELNSTGTSLDNVVVIFRQSPEKPGTGHYGSRMAFRRDGTLFVTLGERTSYAPEAQDLTSQLGKVVRINPDGSIPADNPFVSMGGTAAAVWSLGHRNPQTATLHPSTGDLWVTEHGPQGGDEVNLVLAARNFGWPNVSYGCPYFSPVGTACRIGGGVHNTPYTPPAAFWYPTSTAPGGAMFYTGTRFPEWQGNLFVGGLAGKTLYRLVLDGSKIVGQEPFFAGQHEIRDLKQGPDDWIYMISRSANQILRIER